MSKKHKTVTGALPPFARFRNADKLQNNISEANVVQMMSIQDVFKIMTGKDYIPKKIK